MAGRKKKSIKEINEKHVVKKPTIKQKTLEFEGHLVPIIVDHARASVYRDYKNAWVIPCKLEHSKENPYDAMVRDYGNLIRKGFALVPTVHQLGKRDQVVQSAAMFEDKDEQDKDSADGA
jgi:hypothetical protein